MKLVPLTFFAILLVAFLTFSSASLAAPYMGKAKAKSALKVTNSKQAAQRVKSRFGGKVLKVQYKKSNGQQGYKVKLIKSNGNVISVWVDAKTGRLAKR